MCTPNSWEWPQTVHMYSQFIGMATNSTHVSHEVLAGVVSEQLVVLLY